MVFYMVEQGVLNERLSRQGMGTVNPPIDHIDTALGRPNTTLDEVNNGTSIRTA
jgi:hypothetical protein